MLKVKNNDVIVTRGDDFDLKVNLKRKRTRDAYTPVDGDTLRVAISEGFKGEFGYRLVYEAPVPIDTLIFTIPGVITQNLFKKEYNYDVELTLGYNGKVDTVVQGKLFLTGESL